MKRHNFLAIVVVAMAAGLLAGQASGQYYTPLRYDLRYANPAYIPSGSLRFGPDRAPDPYRFGAYQYGNLSITGNLRLGKSFRGNSPYRDSGSQMAIDLPSTGLSNFRRDSFGVQDLGTGLQYGQTEAYFPGSSSVTTPYSAGSRFATPLPGDRAPYALRDINAPPLPVPGGMLTPGAALPGTAPAAGAVTAGGITIPQSALDFMDALIDGRISPTPAEATEPPDSSEDSGRGPYKSAYERYGQRFESKPGNIFVPRDGTGPHAGDIMVPDEPSSLFWMNRAAGGATGLYMPRTDEETPAGPAPVAHEQAPPGDTATGDKADAVAPTLPQPYMPVSTYAAYVLRAHAAMKEPAYDKAEALYAAAAALEPDRPAAFFGRVHALLGRRMYLQAIVVLERELTKRPQWAKVVPDIKGVFAKADVYGRIIADLTHELGLSPGNVGYNFLLGYVHYAGGDAKTAQQYLEKVAVAREEKPGAEKPILAAIGGG